MWRKQRGSTKSDSAGGHRGHPFTPPLPEPEEEGTPPPKQGWDPRRAILLGRPLERVWCPDSKNTKKGLILKHHHIKFLVCLHNLLVFKN